MSDTLEKNRDTRPIRYVLIGVGAGVFAMHASALRIPGVEVTAVCDVVSSTASRMGRTLGCPWYSSHERMLEETDADVAVVMAPHPHHASITVDCLHAGRHVLVEKPMAVHAAEADRMIDAAAQEKRLLAVAFQHRLRPEIEAARRLLDRSALGAVQHVHVTESYTRTGLYYSSNSWRGSWRGEGGGVLLNQAPHNLDLLCYLLGRPARVTAWNRTRLHCIEAEDTSLALFEWDDGATGSFHMSTAEVCSDPRIEIVGTRGALTIRSGAITQMKLGCDLRDHIRESASLFDIPSVQVSTDSVTETAAGHRGLYINLNDAIRHGSPLVADGEQGRLSLELANAMILSSYEDSAVRLPLDRRRYVGLLEALQAGCGSSSASSVS